MSLQKVQKHLGCYPCRHLVITGGEPLLQLDQATRLARGLKKRGWFVEVETNGTIAPKGLAQLVQFNVSPKLKNSLNKPSLSEKPGVFRAFLQKNAKVFFKFVVRNQRDIDEVKRLATRCGIANEKILLMPEATNKKGLQEKSKFVIELAKANGFRFSPRLQVAHSLR